jgi:Icc-related predicted phosphoesterase
MKLLLSVDTHGETPELNEKVDLVLIAGDFAKGDALRKLVFEGGPKEGVEKEIIESSKKFFNKIKKVGCPIISSIGNAEDFSKEKIVELLDNLGILYTKNALIEIRGLKILLLDFFVERWWARKYRSGKQSTIDRAKREEKEIKDSLSKIDKVDIIVSHLPPNGVLDEDQGMYEKGTHSGSKILRDFILQKRPRLVVCGHIHSPGEAKLGETLIINPGKKKVMEFDN